MLTSVLPALFDVLPSPVFLIDEELRIAAANRMARSVFTAAPENNFQNFTLKDFLDPDDEELFRERFLEVVSGDGTFDDSTGHLLDIQLRTGQDEWRWFAVHCSQEQLPTRSGISPRVSVLTLHDVTDLKVGMAELTVKRDKLTRDVAKLSRKMREDAHQARLNYEVACEQILLAREEKKVADEMGARWRSLTENAPQLVLLLDRKGKVVFCNRMPDGAEAKTKSAQNVHDFIPAHNASMTRRMVSEVVRSKQSKTYEIGGNDQTDTPVWYSISLGPIASKPNSSPESVVLIATDITARKLAEDAVVKHQAELAHVSRLASMGTLTVELAHELNQPLGVIANYVGGCIVSLEESDFDADRIRHAQSRILAETKRAKELTVRVLDFLRKREVPRMLTDIAWLVRDTLPLAALEAQKSQIEFQPTIPDGLPEVKVNRVQIQQILINLISNAVQSVTEAGRTKPEIRIAVQLLRDDWIEISVTDNGLGFDPRQVERLFEPLFTTKERGSGMGLPICRTLVKLHGGQITATGTPGVGARFSFTIPIYLGETSETNPDAEF